MWNTCMVKIKRLLILVTLLNCKTIFLMQLRVSSIRSYHQSNNHLSHCSQSCLNVYPHFNTKSTIWIFFQKNNKRFIISHVHICEGNKFKHYILPEHTEYILEWKFEMHIELYNSVYRCWIGFSDYAPFEISCKLILIIETKISFFLFLLCTWYIW